jgi:Zn-finger nucleic acid-binding protein
VICPVCNKDMIVVEYSNIELDYCLICHGVWFDSDELELLLKCMDLDTPDLMLGHILDSADAETTEKERKCPICRRKMKKTTIGDRPKILIDVCRRKDGLWFDGGEVSELVKELAKKIPAGKEAQHKVISFLGEVFQARG